MGPEMSFRNTRIWPVFLIVTGSATTFIGPTRAGDALDTPIETLAARPQAAAILNKDIPGLLTNSNYGVFKVLTLKQISALSGGRLTRQMLEQTESDLKASRHVEHVDRIDY